MTDRQQERELVRRCRQGQAAAWRALVAQMSPMVFRLAVRMLGRAADAEDACQEVFLRVHRHFDSFDATRPLAPWVAHIAYTTCLRRLRGAMVRATSVTDPSSLEEHMSPSVTSPEEEAASREVASALELALQRLSAQDRALLLLRYREGLSDSEIAQVTEMPVGTVKTRIFRARADLRAQLPKREEVVP